MVSDDMKMPFKCPILGYTENQFAPFYDLYTTIIIMSLAWHDIRTPLYIFASPTMIHDNLNEQVLL